MGRESKYFTLTLESLRALGSWAADCAERALPVYEKHADSDSRPRAAIEGIRAFAGGGRRTAQLRSLALAAYAAAREADDPAAAAAARAAGLAAASAYTHPLADVQQTKHILGPAAYAALALELDHAGVKASVMARFVGQSNTSPLKCAKSCYRCPLVKRETVGWTRSSMSWMRASAA